ncbi:hypothetical protein V8E53_004193, partial [Lactarius tabidus]
MPQLGDAQWAQSGSNQPASRGPSTAPLLPPTEVLPPTLRSPQREPDPQCPQGQPTPPNLSPLIS